MNKLLALYKKHKELFNYLVVGCLTTLVSLAFFYGSVWTFLDGENAVQLQIANVISWTGAVAFAYVMNRMFVFESKAPDIAREIVAFVSSRVATLLLDMGVMFLLATVLRVNYNISKLIAMVLVTVGNYVIAKLFVFKKK